MLQGVQSVVAVGLNYYIDTKKASKDFSIARRAQTDQMIQQKHGGLIAKLSKKLVIPLKKKEKEKVKAARLARQEKK